MAKRISSEEKHEVLYLHKKKFTSNHIANMTDMPLRRVRYIISKHKKRTLMDKVLDFFGFTYE